MWKKAPLTICITVTALFVTLFGGVGRARAFAAYRYSFRDTPVMALFFMGLHDRTSPFTDKASAPSSGEEAGDSAQAVQPVAQQPVTPIAPQEETSQNLSDQPAPIAVPESGALVLPDTLPVDETQPAHNVNLEVESVAWDEPTRNKYSRISLLADPETEIAPTRYFALLPSYSSGFVTVDATYFKDALFIGDSRTVGLSMYVPELNAQATFYAKTSMTAAHVLDQPFVETALGTMTIPQALVNEEFKKIYVALGVNELGTGSTESFVQAYAVLLQRLKELQPDAILFINSIMHVSADKDDEGGYVNNAVINDRNSALSQLADNEIVFYIDMNEATDDASGVLREDLTFDGVHLKAVSYDLWYQYLLEHAIETE